jgi:hypothetical protein
MINLFFIKPGVSTLSSYRQLHDVKTCSSQIVYNREVSHQYEYDNANEHAISSFSNNQMVQHLQAENARISKQINEIMFVWYVTNLYELNDARWRHDLDARTHKVTTCSLKVFQRLNNL